MVVTVVKGGKGLVAQCVRISQPSTRRIRYVGGHGSDRSQRMLQIQEARSFLVGEDFKALKALS